VAVELHLPDLPEVPLSLGPAPGADGTPPPRRRLPWHLRLRDALSTYLPLLLMSLLALGTWWLVKHTPVAGPAPTPSEARTAPDYTMTQFSIERFDRTGTLRVRVEGERLRHYPDTDRYEIDEARIRATSQQGQVTVAVARRALANGDLSELQLHGGAQVDSTGPQGQPLQMKSEFLHAFLVTERVVTHLPVQVTEGANTLEAAGLAYDNGRRLLELTGRLKARIVAPTTPRP
jgi:lipopolysaccharide export system protein LptC